MKRGLFAGLSISLCFLASSALVAATTYLSGFSAVVSIADTDNTFWCQTSGGCASSNPLKRVTAAQIKAYIAASLALTGVPTAPTAGGGTNTTQVATTAFVQNALPAVPVGANPTATAGPTASNGVATTYMRSDASPAVQKGTNAQFGIVEGDGSTITCVAGVCSSIGGSATSIVPGTTTIGGATAPCLIENSTGTTMACAGLGTGVATAFSVNVGSAGAFVVNGGAGGTPSSLTLTNGTGLPISTGVSGLGTGVATALGTATNTSGGPCIVGVSGSACPLLNGTNTWSGSQTFGQIQGTVTTQSGTTYTLASTDCGTEITFTNAAAVTVTIPATLPVGCNIAILQTTAAGQVTVTGTAVTAATLHSAHSYTKTFGQWAIIGINIEANSGGSSAIAILTGDGA